MMHDGIAAEALCPGDGIKFTNGKDLTKVVIPQYKDAFMRLMSEQVELTFAKVGWGDTEVVQLSAALACARDHSTVMRLKMIDLSGNTVSRTGITHLVNVLCTIWDHFVVCHPPNPQVMRRHLILERKAQCSATCAIHRPGAIAVQQDTDSYMFFGHGCAMSHP